VRTRTTMSARSKVVAQYPKAYAARYPKATSGSYVIIWSDTAVSCKSLGSGDSRALAWQAAASNLATLILTDRKTEK
jgi:hypothetical protein